MGNQDRPPPNVERLEPRLTLSTLRPARVRAKALIPHAAHTEVVPPPNVEPPAPISARSVDAESESDGLTLPSRSEWRLRTHGGFEPPSSDGESGHGGSGVHAETTAQPGPIAFAADHDPAHFALVPAYALSPIMTPAATAGHDGMAMGAGMSSRVAVTMPMDHRANPMPRMTPTRDGKPMPMHTTSDPAVIEAGELDGQPHGHDLDPGLDPELSPESDVEITPSMSLPAMPMAGVETGGEGDPITTAPPVAAGAPLQSNASPESDAEHAGPRLAGLSAVAAFFHRNALTGRLERDDDEPDAPGGFLEGLATRVRPLLARLRRTFRKRPRRAGSAAARS